MLIIVDLEDLAKEMSDVTSDVQAIRRAVAHACIDMQACVAFAPEVHYLGCEGPCLTCDGFVEYVRKHLFEAE